MKDFWTRYLTNNHRFTKANSDYRRVVILNFTLVLMILIMAWYGLFNLFFTHNYVFAAIQLSGMALALVVIVFFKRTNNLDVTSVLLVVLFLALLTLVILIGGQDKYMLMWALLVPAVSYFILGRVYGSIVSGIYLLFIAFFLGFIDPLLNGMAFDIGALANVVGAMIAVGLIIRYFELSRSETLDALSRMNDNLLHLSETDKLTSLYNRLKLDAVLEEEIKHAEASLKPLAVLLLDFDDFKDINDRFGHFEGDSVLVQGSFLLKNQIKEPAVIGRWGGEEFLVIAPHMDRETALDVGIRLTKTIEQAFFDEKVRVTVSIGVSV